MDRTLDPFRELFGDDVTRTVAMPVDVVLAGDDVVLAIDLPGVEWSSIDIDAKERTLTIRATRSTWTADGLQWLLRERPTGTLVRRLTLRKGVALDKAEAVYASGVLTVRMPVADEAKPRKIAVSHVDSGWVIGGRVEPTS